MATGAVPRLGEVAVLGDLTAEASLTRIEEEVRRFWRRREVPAAFYAAHRDGSPYVIRQQPLTVAAESATDQARLLATTDLLARYRTMRGDAVYRHTGWVCHGLPVEVSVERSLGPDLAGYDLARFNAACREAAIERVESGETLAAQLGVWPGPGSAFLSLEPQCVGVVWGALRQLYEAGQLRHAHRLASICPRCGTPLSSTEAARHAVQVETRSVWVKLPWADEPNAYFLAQAPQPWMLVGMVALAIHPEAGYALVELAGGESTLPEGQQVQPVRLLLAETALKRTSPGDYRLVRRLRGRALRDARYHPPFTFLPAGEGAGRLLLSERVPLDQGTGLWPVTPAFDGLSLALAQAHRLPVPQMLDDWGGFGDTVRPWRGLAPLDAEPLLVEDLQARGLLFAEQPRSQPQALCPYCETPLLPSACAVWSVETGSGPWIVGRDRAWGVPLPIWGCEQCGQELCLAGLDDLAHRTGLDIGEIDPHRPVLDGLTFPCEECGSQMRRVAAVVDAAFEAAVLSWSTAARSGPEGHPAVALDELAPEGSSQQGMAIGLGDRHLGWLGDLTEVAALLQGTLAWERAHALPESEPDAAWDLMHLTSADAVRWATWTSATPEQAEHDFLRPLWRLAMSVPAEPPPPSTGETPEPPPRSWGGLKEGTDSVLLDRWLAARLHQVSSAMDQALAAQEPARAAGELAVLVSDLADWAAPRQPGSLGPTLGFVSRLLAPFVPHLAEALHRQLGGWGVESVHLTAWPTADPSWADRALLARMARVRRLAALGQKARAQAEVAPDRRLRRAIVGLMVSDRGAVSELDPFQDLLAEALGVEQVQLAPEAEGQVAWRLGLNPERYPERDVTPAEIEDVLAGLDADLAAHLASQLRAGLSIGLQVSGRAMTLLPDEVRLFAQARPGWVAAADDEHLVVLDVG
jgi:isoleucyl-tRNA synthetase